MKKLLLFLFLLPVFGYSQNLVPNGSFEEYQDCPTTMGEISNSLGWKSFGGSPDYFNSCATLNGFNDIGVPRNSFGYQLPYDGNAYAGLFGYSLNPPNAREYLATELSETLVAGKFYTLSFYVCLAYNPYYTNCGFNNIGVSFSNQEFSESNPFLVNNLPYINYNELVYDTMEWIKLSWTFLSDSNYKYISVGNFYDNSNTDTIQYPTLITLIRGYIYIDNIELYECDSLNGFSLIELNKNVYPNPFNNKLHINLTQKTSISILDSNSKPIFIDGNVSNQPYIEIDTSKFTNGIYYLSINQENITKIIKIIKQ